jgi:hypothetical protein
VDLAGEAGGVQPRRNPRDDRPLRSERRTQFQRKVTLEKCRDRIDLLKKQRHDIDSAIAELTEFVALVAKVESEEFEAEA